MVQHNFSGSWFLLYGLMICYIFGRPSDGLLLLQFPETGGKTTSNGEVTCLAPPDPCCVSRRGILLSGLTLITTAADKSSAASSPSPPLSRLDGIGGGVDLLSASSSLLEVADVIYPKSLLGPWNCQRVVTQIEGNKEQAAIAWRLLGGGPEDTFAKQAVETYATRYVPAGEGVPHTYAFEGAAVEGVVLDRGFEAATRAGAQNVVWDPRAPGELRYDAAAGGGGRRRVEAAVVARRAGEPPGAAGWGSDELWRLQEGGGGGGGLLRAARVRRRWRRGVDERTGRRVVEGLEVVTTYRVLDGVAGVEFPTSTAKSQLRLTRPATTQGEEGQA